jgi:hypothetical protein
MGAAEEGGSERVPRDRRHRKARGVALDRGLRSLKQANQTAKSGSALSTLDIYVCKFIHERTRGGACTWIRAGSYAQPVRACVTAQKLTDWQKGIQWQIDEKSRLRAALSRTFISRKLRETRLCAAPHLRVR